MKKNILVFFILLISSCTSVEKYNENEVLASFQATKKMFLSTISQNDKNEIDKFFVYGIRNNIIKRELKKYDFRDFLLIIPDKTIKINSKKNLKTDMLINFGLSTYYFDVNWVQKDNMWKIYSIYEK